MEQLAGHLLVGVVRCVRPMPGAPIRIRVGIGGDCEGAVNVPSFRRRGGAIDP